MNISGIYPGAGFYNVGNISDVRQAAEVQQPEVDTKGAAAEKT